MSAGIEFFFNVAGLQGNSWSINLVNSLGGAAFSVSISGTVITLTLGYTVIGPQSVYSQTYAASAADWNASAAGAIALAVSTDSSTPVISTAGTYDFNGGTIGGAPGVYYWEQVSVALHKFTPQYIKRFNAPGH